MKDETVDVKRDAEVCVAEPAVPMQTPFAELDRLLEAQDLRVPADK